MVAVDTRVKVEGVDGWARSAAKLLARLDAATKRATNDAAHLVERAAKLTLRTYTHPPGTPTPSPPGEPPALVTGFLARSQATEPARPAGTWKWQARTGPTAGYSRIHELGGWTGAGHRTYLPPRPYQKPTTERMRGEIRTQYRQAWAAVLAGGG